MDALQRPAVLIAAPASGQGKTSVAAGLARLWTRQGWRVRAFKCGPDFLDPQWLALATGQPVDNLDLWMNGETDVRARLWQAAQAADVVLIEGVMGLYDGQPSAADLALAWDLPVLAVVSAASMAGTFGAIVHGLRHYRSGLRWVGALANRVAGEAHAAMLRAAVLGGGEAVTDEEAVARGWLGALPRTDVVALPERHLGLTQAAELSDSVARLDALADALAQTPLGRMSRAAWQRWSVRLTPPMPTPLEPVLAGRRIAVARDAAFSFIYPANVQTLQDLGAQVLWFSPLANEPLPDCDAVWLPGGYPELHAPALSAARITRDTLAAHVAAGRPLWAECGGMLALLEALTLADRTCVPMWGILPGRARMQPRLAALGMQAWSTPQGELRGHTFHYSALETSLTPVAHTVPPQGGRRAEAVYAHGSVHASYFHAWFASNPAAVGWLFGGGDGRCI